MWKTVKLAFAIVGLLIGGVLIAWRLGFIFQEGPPPAPEHNKPPPSYPVDAQPSPAGNAPPKP
jgi:hypothetical protein